jgi:tetratricopeptide (TPR) repeat protein
MKTIILGLSFILISCIAFAQKDKTEKTVITGDKAKDLIRSLNLDTTKFLAEAGARACLCIDSISLTNKNPEQISKDIAQCIDKEVTGYQMALKIYHLMVDTGRNKNIIINAGKNSNEYQRYYFEIESYLKDTCRSLNRAVASNNEELENSFSKDDEANAWYNKGVPLLDNENYKEALPYFERAVKEDPKFAFAWDNIGICNRRLNNFDAAIDAYNKSLALDPKGKTPLQNIPVAYEYKKEYDKALDAYLNILKFYPNDPEAYYGAGRIFAFFKIDYEKALQYMCKCYNIYTETKSPYRVDAEKQINYIYGKLKADGKEELFYKILKDNHINPSKN